MKKNLLLRLCLMMSVVLALYSCIHDEVYTASDSSSKEYISKSPWNEDQIYIKKAQQVFLKHANLPRFNETYGELNWDYAMSFGQFGEKYALVPIVKNNRVVLLMETVREGDKVYFYEKKDPELLSFFQHAIYSNIIKVDEQSSGSNGTASKGMSYVCFTRSLTVGCPTGIPDCEPITSHQQVCEWKSTGAPPKGINPTGDPNGDGGGGGNGDMGFEYPEPPLQTPCEKIAEIGKHATTKSLFENLKTKTNSTKEFGEILQESGGQIGNTSIEGEVGQGGIDFSYSGGPIDGFIHSHYTGLLSIFSPADLATLAALNATGNIKDINTFVMGVVTASNTQYMMVIDDPVKFSIFAQQFLLSNGQVDESKTEDFGTLNYFKYNIKRNNLSTANELGFLKLLNDQNSGLKVLKGSNNSNSWSTLAIKNGQIDPKPCN